MIKNKLGKLEIPKSHIQKRTGIFECFNPIQVEHKSLDMYVYTCVSELFEEVKEGDAIPFYDVELKMHQPNGVVSYYAIKLDK